MFASAAVILNNAFHFLPRNVYMNGLIPSIVFLF